MAIAWYYVDNFTFRFIIFPKQTRLGTKLKPRENIYIKYLNENDFRVGKFISLQQKQFHYQTGDFLFAAF